MAKRASKFIWKANKARSQSFLAEMKARPPQAAAIAEVRVQAAESAGFAEFTIRESAREGRPTARISPDLPVCGDCLRELGDPQDPRYQISLY